MGVLPIDCLSEASFHIRTIALAIRDVGDDLYGYQLASIKAATLETSDSWGAFLFGYFWRQGRDEGAGTWRTCPLRVRTSKTKHLAVGQTRHASNTN